MLIEADTVTLLLVCCLSEYGILLVYKFIICAEVKRKDSFPDFIGHFVQVNEKNERSVWFILVTCSVLRSALFN